MGDRFVDLFIGHQECTVDDKRRFSLPPKYRLQFSTQELPSGLTHLVVLVPWYGGALAALPVRRWEEIQTRLLLLDFSTPDLLDAKRQCLPRMDFTHTDPEGRLLLSPDHHGWLRLPAKGKGRVVVTGVGQHLEIWNADEWPEVRRTGQNAATRDAADIQYDKQLEVLMRAALEMQRARPAAAGTPDGGAGETETG